MDRYTKKDAERAFRYLCEVMGKEVGYEAGQWYLDSAPSYGGYIIASNCSTGGSRYPIVNTRRQAREFVRTCHFAIDAIRLMQQEVKENG